MSSDEYTRGALITVPNFISLVRIVLTPVTAWAILHGVGFIVVTAFCLVVSSDLLDGMVARALDQSSKMGTLIDHIADAVFVVTTTAVFGYLGVLPIVLPVLISIAFTQYVLDSRALEGSPLRPSQLGRWNGIAYYGLTAGAIVAYHFAPNPHFLLLLHVVGWVLIGSTIWSVVERASFSFRN